MNLKLEELRTKEELIKYFKTLGKKITEKELNALKQSYEQFNANNVVLSLEQLDRVAGGLHICVLYDPREKKYFPYVCQAHEGKPIMPGVYESYLFPIIHYGILEHNHMSLIYDYSFERLKHDIYRDDGDYLPINFGSKVFYFCISPDKIRLQLKSTFTNPEELELHFNSYISRLSKYIYAEKFLEKYSDISNFTFYDLLQRNNLKKIVNIFALLSTK